MFRCCSCKTTRFWWFQIECILALAYTHLFLQFGTDGACASRVTIPPVGAGGVCVSGSHRWMVGLGGQTGIWRLQNPMGVRLWKSLPTGALPADQLMGLWWVEEGHRIWPRLMALKLGCPAGRSVTHLLIQLVQALSVQYIEPMKNCFYLVVFAPRFNFETYIFRLFVIPTTLISSGCKMGWTS